MPKPPSEMSPNKTSAIVAGGAGFVGSFLCESLLTLDTQVVCIDNFISGKHENISHLLDNDNFYLIENDINSVNFLDDQLFPAKINYIFHLASVEEYLSDTATYNTLDTNSRGVENLLNLAIKNGSKFLFASSFDVFSQNYYPHNLNDDFSKETKWDNQNFHEGKRFSELLISDYYKRFKTDIRLIRLGQIYGPRMNLFSGDILNHLFYQAITGTTIKVPSLSEELLYPVYVSDVISGILRAMFIPGAGGEIFNLFSLKGENVLNFVNTIQKTFRDEYGKQLLIEQTPPTYKKTLGKMGEINFPAGWEPTVNDEEGISKTAKWLYSLRSSDFPVNNPGPIEQQKVENNPVEVKETLAKEEIPVINKIESVSPQTVRIDRNKSKYITGFWQLFKISIITFAVGVITIISVLGFYLLSSIGSIKRIQELAMGGDFVQLKKESFKLQYTSQKAQSILQIISGPLSAIGLEGEIQQSQKLLYLAEISSDLTNDMVNLADAGSKLSEYMMGDQTFDVQATLSDIHLQNEASLEKVSLIQGVLDTMSGNEMLIGSKIKDLKKVIPEAKSNLLTFRDLLGLAPTLIGINGKVSYLILFQNNMELRPGGGFIGSYAIIDLVNGKMTSYKVYDVYNADGQLKGHVEPPADLKKYLNIDGWYLRDSNWSVDFPTNAMKAEWFLDKETGLKVDGVIAIDLNVAQKVLRGLGEVYLPDYDEKITAENFFQKAEYHTEAGFFPGSSQKGDYLGNVSRILLDKIKNSDEQTKGKIMLGVLSSINEKDILFYNHDQDVAVLLSKNNWDGGIKTPQCLKTDRNCFVDYLMVSDANVGVNKANYYLTREVSQEININANGKVDKKIEISYENKSPNNVFPAGDYKTFLRILVPFGSAADNCVIYRNGNSIENEKCDMETTTDQGKTSFGIFANIPVGEKRKIEIDYSLPETNMFTDGDYLLFVQKQPGTSGDAYQFSFSFPESLSLVSSNQSVLTRTGQIVYNALLLQDIPLELGFTK